MKMLQSLSIRAKLLAGAVVAVVIILGMGGLSFVSSQQSISALGSVYENQVVPASSLNAMDSRLKEVRFRMAGVLLDQMPTVGSMNHAKEVKEELPKLWAQFREQTKDNHFTEEGQELINKIDGKMASLNPFLDSLMAAYSAGDKAKLGSMLEDDWPVVQGSVVKPLSQLVPIQEAAAKDTYEGSVASARRMLMIQGVIMLVGLAIMIGFALQLVRMISRNIALLNGTLDKVAGGDLTVRVDLAERDELGQMADSLNRTVSQLRQIVGGVKQAADSVADASSRLSAEADTVMGRAQKQTDGVMEISAAMEQSSVSVNEVAQNADGVEQAALNTKTVAQSGNANMVKSIEATRRIEEAVSSSSATIAGLSDAINRVGEITQVIKEIAEQTNLLALNAAIEAARAGEQGRGFAVVADEVRKLAERTAASTADITNMVDTIKSSSGAAVSAIDRIEQEVQEGANFNRLTGESLNQIVEAAVKVSDSAHQIATAVKEQSLASEEIARNMERISSITEENSFSIQEVDTAAKQLSSTASELQHLVGKFKVAG
ncbi:MAG: methyl-accepting chemotaxis protein [Hydrogenophilaceae bacterium]|nr:methyl-accepting chemotaxis protein [Hydrogenophilaceae bacterium]